MKRTIALALAATVATAGAATADSYFTIIDRQDSAILDLGTVVSDLDGVVEIRDSKDAVLGQTTVRAGANDRVRVDVKTTPNTDLTAVLVADGNVLAEGLVRVDRDN
ncbi:hypothetical protein [Histidinibacterium aquaticum]|uniref:DUF5666 domain-containing protein n=1 Tax=Histidinibacterium aquaticum TaxID=2613962 RepID=A0A5J5GB33_9RHOB|nr:hypothetical protein [Histidinibacterium aquaticum]KAA9005201.1 hypothetical protein F3S47_18015 [Histidinibacterium aquaticum]